MPIITEEQPNLEIKDIKVTTLKTKSVLTWDIVKGAESYNVYKQGEDDAFELIENVTEPRFEVEITGDEIKHDYFAVEALGRTASGELITGDLSEATKVQTGPEMIILFIISLLIG